MRGARSRECGGACPPGSGYRARVSPSTSIPACRSIASPLERIPSGDDTGQDAPADPCEGKARVGPRRPGTLHGASSGGLVGGFRDHGESFLSVGFRCLVSAAPPWKANPFRHHSRSLHENRPFGASPEPR